MHDFIILGSDGIFDVLTSKEVVKLVWNTLMKFENGITFSEFLQLSVKNILIEAMKKGSQDNVSVIIIAFKSLLSYYKIRINQKETELKGVNAFPKLRYSIENSKNKKICSKIDTSLNEDKSEKPSHHLKNLIKYKNLIKKNSNSRFEQNIKENIHIKNH